MLYFVFRQKISSLFCGRIAKGLALILAKYSIISLQPNKLAAFLIKIYINILALLFVLPYYLSFSLRGEKNLQNQQEVEADQLGDHVLVLDHLLEQRRKKQPPKMKRNRQRARLKKNPNEKKALKQQTALKRMRQIV